MPRSERPSVPSDARLTLITLGRAELRVHAGAADATVAFEAGKPLALLAYLAASPHRAAAREHLIDLLWSDLEPDPAKHALRQTLWYLRRRAGEQVVATDGDGIVLGSTVSVDRDDFLAAVDRDDLESATRAYGGEFLPRFAAPGGAEFERWAAIERSRLRTLFIRSAEGAARRAMVGGRAREAQSLVRRARDTEPLNQGAWRLLLETLLAAHDTLGASMEADALERMLRDEEIEPEPSTRAALRAVRRQHATVAHDVVPADAERPRTSLVAELVGREREFAAILSCWEAARSGAGGHVHVVARAGFGKSRLLADLHARLRATRARVVAIRASLATRDIPYTAVGDLVAALGVLPGARGVSAGAAAALVALDPRLSSHFQVAPDSAVGGEAVRRRTLAVRELMLAVSEDHPLGVLIDDLHWADAASRQLLRGVLHGAAGARTLIVTTSRPDVETFDGETTLRVELAPLTVADVGGLLESVASLPNARWAVALPRALHEATDGSPLLVIEALQLLLERELLARTETGWTTADPDALFATLHQGSALRARVTGLPSAEQCVLLLLAVAGGPLGMLLLERAAAAWRTCSLDCFQAAHACTELERRGLIERRADDWTTSHDEIARTALDAASPNDRRSAEAAIAHALLGEQSDMRALRRAAPHLARADDQEALGVLFHRVVRDARRDGDARTTAALAEELLGSETNDARVSALIGALPLSLRVGHATRRRALAVGAVVLAAPALMASALWLRRELTPPPPIATLIAMVYDSAGARMHTSEVRDVDWSSGGPITIDVRRRPRLTMPHVSLNDLRGFSVRPSGAGWIVSRAMPAGDSGVIDLADLDGDGTLRRLTWVRGDDEAPTASPDDSLIVFSTARWDSLSRYDLAVLERRTGAVRPLTHDDNYDSGVVWRADGASIAFIRRHFNKEPTELCTIAVDGSGLRCAAPHDFGMLGVLGWTNDGELLVQVHHDSIVSLARMASIDARPRSLSWIVEGYARLSPDGRWVLCECRRVEDRGGAWVIFAADRPSDFRLVDVVGAHSAEVRLYWGPSSLRLPYMDRLEIVAEPGSPILGLPYQLAARGLDVAGRTITPSRITWSSLTPDIATVDSLGRLRPRHAGRVRIRASAGGWRSAERDIAIHDAPSHDVLVEDWSRGIDTTRWRPFGIPRPTVVTDEVLGTAFLNAGDGSFSSGVHTVRRFPVADGLGIDVLVRSDFSLPQWRENQIAIFDHDSASLARWDHATADFPAPRDEHKCELSYPGGETARFDDSISINGTGFARMWRAPRRDWQGKARSVRLQVFPDGRCGYAIDGRPIWISPPSFTSGAGFVQLYGASRWSRMLVGRVTVYTGVRNDIDWSQVDH